MSLWRIAWRSIQQRALASALTAFSVGLGVALVVAVLVIHNVIDRSFRRGAQGYDLVVGAKGSPLLLVLGTVFHLNLNRPLENIPWSYYEEFTEGRFVQAVEAAVPVCTGHDFKGCPAIATTPAMFDELTYQDDRSYEFVAGRNFKADQPFEAVIGSTAARLTGLKVGEKFRPVASGPGGHEDEVDFEIVGILAPTGTPNDRAIFMNIEGFFLCPAHQQGPSAMQRVLGGGEKGKESPKASGGEHKAADKNPTETNPEAKADQLVAPERGLFHAGEMPDVPAETEKHPESGETSPAAAAGAKSDDAPAAESTPGAGSTPAAGESGAKPAAGGPDHQCDEHCGHDHDHAHDHEHKRELTAILVRTNSKAPHLSMVLADVINREASAQAVYPTREIIQFFDTVVGNVQLMLLILAVLVVVVASVGILVSIYNSMSDRRHEIAIMRALGASRLIVMGVILLESILLSLGGGVVGIVLGHGLIGAMGPMITDQTGVQVAMWDFQLIELVLIPGLIFLATVVGYLPAAVAYRTDVARSLQAGT